MSQNAAGREDRSRTMDGNRRDRDRDRDRDRERDRDASRDRHRHRDHMWDRDKDSHRGDREEDTARAGARARARADMKWWRGEYKSHYYDQSRKDRMGINQPYAGAVRQPAHLPVVPVRERVSLPNLPWPVVPHAPYGHPSYQRLPTGGFVPSSYDSLSYGPTHGASAFSTPDPRNWQQHYIPRVPRT